MDLTSNYAAGLCEAVVISRYDVQRLPFMDAFVCSNGLAMSLASVAEVPVAMPASADAAAALSLWNRQLFVDTGKSYLDFESKYHAEPQCAYTVDYADVNDTTPLTVTNMLGNIIALLFAAVIAIVLKLSHQGTRLAQSEVAKQAVQTVSHTLRQGVSTRASTTRASSRASQAGVADPFASMKEQVTTLIAEAEAEVCSQVASMHVEANVLKLMNRRLLRDNAARMVQAWVRRHRAAGESVPPVVTLRDTPRVSSEVV